MLASDFLYGWMGGVADLVCSTLSNSIMAFRKTTRLRTGISLFVPREGGILENADLPTRAQIVVSLVCRVSKLPSFIAQLRHQPLNMPPELIPDDEEYVSGEDSDFAPDAVPTKGEDEESSDEEPELVVAEVKTKPTKRKRGDVEEAEDAGFENSGDEAIIERGLKRQKRKKKGKDRDEVLLDDEGGEGGLVKTRSMRAAEYILPSTIVYIYMLIMGIGKQKKRSPSKTPPNPQSTSTPSGPP